MTADMLLAEEPSRRAPWLMTLADLLLLLVGFFVFLQANQALDARAIGDGIRGGFGLAPQPVAPMALEVGAVTGFAPGSATIASDTGAALDWARDATRDPRTILTITGQVDGSTIDVDAATGSPAILAADRARAAAALLSRVVAPDRLRIDTGTGGRIALLHIGFAGGSAGNEPIKETQK